MAQEFLHGANVVAAFEQGSGKRVAKRVWGRWLADSGMAQRIAHRTLDGLRSHVVSANGPRARIDRSFGRDKHILPSPFTRGVRIFSFERPWQIHFAPTVSEVRFM